MNLLHTEFQFQNTNKNVLKKYLETFSINQLLESYLES